MEPIKVDKPAMLETMNEASIKKEELSANLPFETEEVGTLNIVAHNTIKNKRGNKNINGMTVTINPNIVPYGTIVYIEELGFRYNQPSDFSDDSNNVYVYFKNDSEASKWNGTALKTLIVKNQEMIDFSSQSIVKTTLKGHFRLTAYCPCSRCCEKYSAPPENKIGASEAYVYEDVTVASDPSVLPYGSVIYIEGVGIRFVNDCGGAIKQNRIDVYFAQHSSASEFGVKYQDVYVIQ
jgi:3D (Asp-Asp-Asp) domain-containing protein